MDLKQNEDGWFAYNTQRSPPPVETKPQHTGQPTTVAPAPVLVETARIEPRCAGPDHGAVPWGSTSPNSVPITVVPAPAPVKIAQIKPQRTGPDHDAVARGTAPSPDSIPGGTASQPATAVMPERAGPDYDAISRGSTPSLNSISDETASQFMTTNGHNAIPTIQALIPAARAKIFIADLGFTKCWDRLRETRCVLVRWSCACTGRKGIFKRIAFHTLVTSSAAALLYATMLMYAYCTTPPPFSFHRAHQQKEPCRLCGTS